MSAPSRSPRPGTNRSPAGRSLFLLLLLVVLLPVVPGCGGCWRADPAAQKKKEEEERKRKEEEAKKKPDFEIGRLRVQPDDPLLNTYEVKPGHWVSTTQELRANNFNFPGELLAVTTSRTGRPVELERSPYYFSSARPAPLPKGQLMNLEVTYFIPRAADGQKQNVQFDRRLQSQRGGRQVLQDRQPTTYMPAYRYYFVGLSTRPETYGYLKRLDTVSPPWDDLSGALSEALVYYRVALPPVEQHVPLPEHPLTWTSIAGVLWDDLDPAALTPNQQQAMLDWLHWGGQLLVSGPGSLDRLRDSFLGPFLPASGAASGPLTQDDFTELNRYWSQKSIGPAGRGELVVDPERPPSGIRLALRPGGEFLAGAGGLVAERRAGRGRVVVTSFSLTSRTVINWPHFDDFFNGALLRRPGRTFKPGELDTVVCEWTRYPHLLRDARLVSSVRYFTRDIARDDLPEGEGDRRPAPRPDRFDPFNPSGPELEERPYVAPTKVPGGDPWRFGGYHSWAESGVGGWNDFSGAAAAARGALLEAAGISIPNAGFVLRVLGVYLLVLVPLNWLLFRLIGRVEWAWFAAPVIALLGAVGVIRLAQLDIGFARSRTEVGILELQGGYGRGHLTRYSALYTSLSSKYEFAFKDPTALALPFAVDPRFERLAHQQAGEVTARHERGVRLEGFGVASNSIGMVHCEEMVELGDGLRWETAEEGEGGILTLTNGTPLTLHDVGLLRRTEAGGLQGAWIGELPPKRGVQPRFEAMPHPTFTAWEESPVMGSGGPEGELALHKLLQAAARQLELAPGEVRLLAWTDAPPGSLAVTPEAAQTTLRTFVLAHLTLGRFPAPERDANTHAAVKHQLDPRGELRLE